MLFLVAVGATASCAKPIYQTAGTAGPLRWQVVDVEQIRRSIDGKETDAQDFTLVLRETHGVGLTLNYIKFDAYKPGYEVKGGELINRLELPAYCELHLAFSSAGFTDPLWKFTLTGNDERGHPVNFTIDLAVSTGPSRPAVPPEAPPDGLFGSFTLGERRRLQVVTAHVEIIDFESLFSSRERRVVLLLSGATVVFDPRVPLVLRRGLRNVAASLVPGAIDSDTTLTLALDLSPYGGAPGAFRFTHSARDPTPGSCAREVLIEPVNRGSDAAQDALTPGEVSARLAQHDFRISPGWSEGERLALTAVVARIPDHYLARVKGLTFNRAHASPTESEEAGEYELDAQLDVHAITMFDNVFIPSMTRVGAPGSTAATYSIAHEIGHAFDYASLRHAAERYRLVVAAFERAFSRHETSPGSGQYRIPPDQKSAWDEHMQQITAVRQAMEAGRSASGSRWQVRPDSREFEISHQEGTGDAVSDFRQAAITDGPVRITKYSEKNWREYFAECFSLYVLDRQFLEWLRPNIYQYFAKHFPR